MLLGAEGGPSSSKCGVRGHAHCWSAGETEEPVRTAGARAGAPHAGHFRSAVSGQRSAVTVGLGIPVGTLPFIPHQLLQSTRTRKGPHGRPHVLFYNYKHSVSARAPGPSGARLLSSGGRAGKRRVTFRSEVCVARARAAGDVLVTHTHRTQAAAVRSVHVWCVTCTRGVSRDARICVMSVCVWRERAHTGHVHGAHSTQCRVCGEAAGEPSPLRGASGRGCPRAGTPRSPPCRSRSLYPSVTALPSLCLELQGRLALRHLAGLQQTPRH